MERTRRPYFLPVASALLVVICLAWAANQLHLRHLTSELQSLADEKMAEFEPNGEMAFASGDRMGAKVVVAKPYVFWGAPSGKVSVFIGHNQDGGAERIDGFDFFFARDAAAAWILTESGHCASDECSVEGKAVLDALNTSF